MSRGESTMSRLKGRGLLKDDMKKWTLWEFQRHYASLHERYRFRVTEALKKYIVKDTYSSDYVLKKMNAAMLESSDYKINPKPGTKTIMSEEAYDDQRQLPGKKYLVERKSSRKDGKKNYVHEVFIPDNIEEWPSVNNRKFTVCLIPTAHIARVFSELLDRKFLSKKTLNPYWHVENHPLFQEVYNDVFFDSAVNNHSNNLVHASKRVDVVPIIDVNCYKLIHYPKHPNARYSTLHGTALKLIEAVKNNPVLYKKTFVQLNSMMESIITHDENNGHVVTYPLAPNRSKESSASKGHMAGQRKYITITPKTKRSVDTCKTCEKRNPNNCKGHRKGSLCPFYQDFCKICVNKGKFINTHCSQTCPNKKKDKCVKKSSKATISIKKKRKLTVDTNHKINDGEEIGRKKPKNTMKRQTLPKKTYPSRRHVRRQSKKQISWRLFHVRRKPDIFLVKMEQETTP